MIPPRITGEEARAIRQELGLSQAAFAQLLDMSPANGERSIRRWEKQGPPLAAGLAMLWLKKNWKGAR